MQDSNESQVQSPAPDFNQELRNAQATGDFDFVLETAKKSHKMLCDFRDVIKRAQFIGADSHAIAMGLNFMENMISNSAQQVNALKQTEKQTREAIKAALKAQKDSPSLAVVDPEKAKTDPEPPPSAPAPDKPENPSAA